MPIPKPKKINKKDLAYNIAVLRQEMFRMIEKVMLLESVINKYIEMKKDTDKFNKYLQDQVKGAEDEKPKKNKK